MFQIHSNNNTTRLGTIAPTMPVEERRSLGITLFESQIIRNYFCTDKINIIKSLSMEFNVTIFTSSNLVSIVNTFLLSHELALVKVCTYEKAQEKKITSLFSSPLRWALTSQTLYVKAKRRSTVVGLIRLIMRALMSRSRTLQSIMRQGISFTISQESILEKFSSPPPEKIDFILSTSLTNFVEDFPVALYFKRRGASVIGTVRSWDNLTSHGSFYLRPDVFLSHGSWMRNVAIEKHGLRPNQIVNWGTPPYIFSDFKPTKPESKCLINVTYASMGQNMNPDDESFISWLVEAWKKLPSNYYLTILQHPKFVVEPSKTHDRIQVRRLEYENSSLNDYFSFLSQQQLVICGGTSVMLDCSFTETPVVLVGFEISSVEYWSSALRVLDRFDHISAFTNEAGYPIANSKHELLNTILKNGGRIVDRTQARSFVGNWQEDPVDGIKAALNYILSKHSH